jgi:predicted PhzF superfamily epimerase YddE/YHI9
MASKKIIEKLTGRVFGHLETKGGGNPITVFASRDERSVLSKAQREHLATTCAWESVFVNASSTTTTSHPQMAFYMPTGEQVSFCAHAALAGTTALSDQADEERNVQFQTEDFTGIESNPGNIYTSTLHDRNIVSVDMTAEWTEEPGTCGNNFFSRDSAL